MAMKFHGSVRGEVKVNFLALFASKPQVFMCGALKLFRIVRANVRLNFEIPSLGVKSPKIRGLRGTSVWRPQLRYTVSRIECRIKFPQNQRCRAKIALQPPNQGVAPFSGPPCRTFLSFAAGRGCGGLVEGIAAFLGSEKRIALQGGIAATVTPVALLCATKSTPRKP